MHPRKVKDSDGTHRVDLLVQVLEPRQLLGEVVGSLVERTLESLHVLLPAVDCLATRRRSRALRRRRSGDGLRKVAGQPSSAPDVHEHGSEALGDVLVPRRVSRQDVEDVGDRVREQREQLVERRNGILHRHLGRGARQGRQGDGQRLGLEAGRHRQRLDEVTRVGERRDERQRGRDEDGRELVQQLRERSRSRGRKRVVELPEIQRGRPVGQFEGLDSNLLGCRVDFNVVRFWRRVGSDRSWSGLACLLLRRRCPILLLLGLATEDGCLFNGAERRRRGAAWLGSNRGSRRSSRGDRGSSASAVDGLDLWATSGCGGGRGRSGRQVSLSGCRVVDGRWHRRRRPNAGGGDGPALLDRRRRSDVRRSGGRERCWRACTLASRLLLSLRQCCLGRLGNRRWGGRRWLCDGGLGLERDGDGCRLGLSSSGEGSASVRLFPKKIDHSAISGRNEGRYSDKRGRTSIFWAEGDLALGAGGLTFSLVSSSESISHDVSRSGRWDVVVEPCGLTGSTPLPLMAAVAELSPEGVLAGGSNRAWTGWRGVGSWMWISGLAGKEGFWLSTVELCWGVEKSGMAVLCGVVKVSPMEPCGVEGGGVGAVRNEARRPKESEHGRESDRGERSGGGARKEFVHYRGGW